MMVYAIQIGSCDCLHSSLFHDVFGCAVVNAGKANVASKVSLHVAKLLKHQTFFQKQLKLKSPMYPYIV